MSWFIDIANKAEDLLNQVDKTAASALQNKQKIIYGDPLPLHKPKFFNKGSTSETLQIEPTFSSSGNTQLYRDTLLKASKDKIRQSYTKSISFQNKKPESDDEKLMEFLNSSDDAPLISVRDTSIPKLVKHDGTTSMSKPADFISNKPEASDFLPSEVNELEHVQEEISETLQKNLSLPTTLPEIESELKSSSPVNISGHSSESELSASENLTANLKTTNFSDCTLEKEFVLGNDTEVNVLHQDLLAIQKRAEQAESEKKRMQKKLEHWNSQISGNDKQVKELMEREADLKAAIDAKDSQLAVLKVRLQEADQALTIKSIAVEDLKCESERLLKDQTNTAIHHNQLVQDLQEKLQNVEHELHREKENYHTSQTEHFRRMNKMEEEQNNLAGNFRDLQKRLSEVKEKNKELISQLKSTSGLLENLQEEYADYKQKAQRILQSKERLILSLKDSNTEFDSNANESMHTVLCAEIDELKQERDLLREELRKAADSIETYKAEVQDLEKISQNDSDNAREYFRNLEEQLRMEKLYKEELELLNSQLKEELKFLREDLSRSKSSFQNRIQDREIEIEKLRRQLMAKSLSTVSQDELESRLHALTENLIQKQTIVEALSTEKNSLVLQLERLEQQLKEAQSYGSHHTVVGVNPHESDRKLKSNLFTENPFDSSLTRKVKRMYGSIDAFSVRLGVFFRRYPVARVFVITYMLLLHLWVMVVLLTYQPEIHNYGKEGNKQS